MPRELHHPRYVALDALRFLALLRVFLWHATGWALLTWVAALPALMYTTGILLAASYANGGLRATLYRRFRRFLIPFWAYGLVAVGIMYTFGQGYELTLTRMLRWVVPYAVPQGADWTFGWLSNPLWYLTAYMWLLMLSPLLYVFIKKMSLKTCVICGFLQLSFVAALEHTYATSLWLLQDVALYGFFLYMGMVTTVKQVKFSRNKLLMLMSCAGALVIGVRTVGDYEGHVVNDSHFTHALMGLVCIAMFRLFEKYVESFFKKWDVFLRYVSSRSLTIYMWHSGVIALSILAVDRIIAWQYYSKPLSIGFALIATLLLAHVAGFLETYSGGVKLKISGKSVALSVAALTVYGLFVSTALLTTNYSYAGALPVSPSQAPTHIYAADTGDYENFFDNDNLSKEQTATLDVAGNTFAINQAPAAPATIGGTYIDPADPGVANIGTEKEKTGAGNTSSAPARTTGSTPYYTAPALGVTSSWQQLAPDASYETRAIVETILESHTNRDKYGNMQLVIVKPGDYKIVLGDAPSSTVYDISSVTKSFTGSLVLRAIAEGKLSLDSKLGILPAAPGFKVGANVTVGALLTHRSGIVDYTHTAEYKKDPNSISDWQTALETVQSYPLLFEPGTSGNYSSTNYILLGLLLEEVYGMDIERLIEAQLLLPLGLESSGVRESTPGRPGKGTGNMYSSMEDLARWVNARWRTEEVVATKVSKKQDRFAGELTGYGEWSFCPCQTSPSTGLTYSALGISGGDITLRYYPVKDIIVIVRMDRGIWDGGREEYLNKIVTTIVKAL